MSRKHLYKELSGLVQEPSYIYVLCMMLTNDLSWNLMEMEKSNPHERLLPFEFSVIVSFMVANQIDLTFPNDVDVLMSMKSKTERIMSDIHRSFIDKDAFQSLLKNHNPNEPYDHRILDEIEHNMTIESILYSGEGVYDFQFTDYLERRYILDKDYLYRAHGYDLQKIKYCLDWLDSLLREKRKNVGLIFYPDKKQEIESEIRRQHPDNVCCDEIEKTLFKYYIQQFVDSQTLEREEFVSLDAICSNVLNLYLVTHEDIWKMPEIENFLQLFSCRTRIANQDYFHFDNLYEDYLSNPIINMGEKGYFIPILLYLYRAAYERPFFLMINDESYKDTASSNRGNAAETIVFDMLAKVFGQANIYRGVKIYKGKNTVSDIDVLCVAGGYSLIVQVKSKKLTTAARHGNPIKFSRDFQVAYQEAYKQGLKCRNAVLCGDVKLKDHTGKTLDLSVNEAYILCVTTDDCASIALLVENHIERSASDPCPVALSIFDLEIFVHYLNKPALFLYYMKQRAVIDNRLHLINEVGCLAHHLINKLYPSQEFSDLFFDQSYAIFIDKHYNAFRKGISTDHIEDAFNARWTNPKFELLCDHINTAAFSGYIDVLFALYDLSSEARELLIDKFTYCKELVKSDKRIHTCRLVTNDSNKTVVGYSIVVSSIVDRDEAIERLELLCEVNKYKYKSDRWIGFGSFIESDSFIDYYYHNYKEWVEDSEMDDIVSSFDLMTMGSNSKIIVGRNDPCPCGSNRKYKKCCGRSALLLSH